MIAAWMLYTAAIGGVISVVAIALDRAARTLRIPVRMIWMAAMVATIAWPIALHVRPSATSVAITQSATAGEAAVDGAGAVVSPATQSESGWRASAAAIARSARRFDAPLLLLWGAMSLVLLAGVARSVVRLRRVRRGWRRAFVDDVRVLVSPAIGPAVVGVNDLEIVLPRWALALDAESRQVVLRHEDEHRRARDPYLLLAAAVGTALMPWNIALWLQRSRLRLAIELDCDARVLRRGAHVDRYGALLLTVASQHRPSPIPAAAALIEPVSNLERRITAMTEPTPRHPHTVAGALLAIAVAAIAVAAIAPAPDAIAALRGRTELPPPATRSLSAAAEQTSQQGRVYAESEVDVKATVAGVPSTPEYPGTLRAAAVEGTVVAQFVVRADGSVDTATFRAIRSTHALFTDAVRNNVRLLRFSAARRAGSAVAQRVEMSFSFSLARPSVPTSATTAGRAGGGWGARAMQPPTGPVTPQPGAVTGRQEAIATGAVYRDADVDSIVRVRPGSRGPTYPVELREIKVEGSIVAEFVVDVDGVVVISTFKEIQSTHALFTAAVRAHLAAGGILFDPAKVGGRPVKQLVRMPFVFTLSR